MFLESFKGSCYSFAHKPLFARAHSFPNTANQLIGKYIGSVGFRFAVPRWWLTLRNLLERNFVLYTFQLAYERCLLQTHITNAAGNGHVLAVES